MLRPGNVVLGQACERVVCYCLVPIELVGISLAVGRLTLDQLGEVRILDPQPVSPVFRAEALIRASATCTIVLFIRAHHFGARTVADRYDSHMDLYALLERVWTAYSTGWGLWVSGGMYLWFACCLMAIARKSHVSVWWASLVPVVNFKVMCAAGKSSNACFWRLSASCAALVLGIALWIPAWIVVWLVLWAVAWAVAWARISHERGRSRSLGLLAPIPVLNLVLFGVLAFGDQPQHGWESGG